jgi:exosortase D (VPLPA-CTERM-specific)
MSISSTGASERPGLSAFFHMGLFWFLIATLGALIFFRAGIEELLIAWQLPEYSHGPLIPVLSLLLFLRQLKEHPVTPGVKTDRWPGVALVVVSLLLGALGTFSRIHDIVAYALILWVGGILLISFGWRTGRHFWPPVLHLVYMLPLPGTIYYKVSTSLQFLSSELGVWFLQLAHVPVFLDGNIIDLGVLKMHVAEACSGLRYMFPILSFSYIFAVLYRGPTWHKAVLLVSAVPIAIFMNSVRIAVAGIIVQYYGVEWLEGFTHFFEGWVIFLCCIVILFGLARLMLFLHPDRLSLATALDLDTSGLGTQAARIQHVQPSAALMVTAVLMLGSAAAISALPEPGGHAPARESFLTFPRKLGDWQQAGPREILDARVAKVLGADDYLSIQLVKPGAGDPVNLFMAWYDDQSDGGVHSPEVCLPGAGWEIAWLERTDITAEMGADKPFEINRAIIQKGETRMMVYYWFQQRDRRLAWDFAAKFWLMVDGLTQGRTDGAIVRLTTPIDRQETDDHAEARLKDMLRVLQDPLPRFVPNE